MKAGDRVFALYRDGQPQEAAIKDALAAAMVALVRLKGRRHAAALFQAMANGIESGKLGGPVEPQVERDQPAEPEQPTTTH